MHLIGFFSGELGFTRHCRNLHMLENGFVVSHDFSGFQCVEQALTQLRLDLEQVGLPKGMMVIYRNSEKSAMIRKLSEEGNLSPLHSFPSVQDMSVL